MAEPVRWPLALRRHLGDDGVAALLAAQKEWKEDVLTTATDRFERRLVEECAKLRIEMGALRADLVAQMTDLRADFTAQVGGLAAEVSGSQSTLRQEIASTRAEILRWSFVFWIGQVGAIVGLFLSKS